MLSNQTIIDIIQCVVGNKDTRPLSSDGEYRNCYRIHISHIFGTLLSSREIPSDVHGIVVEGQTEYEVSYDIMTMWFTCRPK